MKNLEKAEIAVIGGTGFERLFKDTREVYMGTPFGIPPVIHIGKIDNRDVSFLPRHGKDHSVPPHKINYRANIYALKKLGVKRILATNAVGAINPDFGAGDIVIPHDIIDFTKLRHTTFYDKSPVTHIDLSQPYCPQTREFLVRTAKEMGFNVRDEAVFICTEGPRYETPAEIRMFRLLGCDIVGMTGVPEATLARELEICYASICYVSNMAAGMQKRLTVSEVSRASKNTFPKIEQVLIGTIKVLPRERDCSCATALEEARLE